MPYSTSAKEGCSLSIPQQFRVPTAEASHRTAHHKNQRIPRGFPNLNQSGETCIVSDSVGYYKVCDLNGRVLSRTYQNALYSEGSNLYAGWVKDRTYEIFYCPAGGSAKVLYTVTWDVSTPTELPTDGAGLYALQTDDRTVVCIDSFGQTVGTAKAAFKVSNIAFEDGVLVLQGENQQIKCLPTGEIIS